MFKFFLFAFFSQLCFQPVNAQSLPLGKLWYDTEGRMINAHSAGMLFHNKTYYWFGEFKGFGALGNVAMDGVSCYSSKDLVNWKNKGLALKMITDTNSMLQPGCIVERPKVIYNTTTKKFVMWFHHELKGKGYTAALTGLAVADKPEGPYQYIKSIRPHAGVWPVNFPDSQKKPLEDFVVRKNDTAWRKKVIDGILVRRDFETGQMSRDMTLYVDDDGTGYHLASSEDNQTLHVSKLSEDYLNFADEYYRVLEGQSNEAPAIFKKDKKYYLFTSGTTGWKPNPARSFVADKIYGPWKALGNPVRGSEKDKATTFKSQSTYILPIQGKKNQFIYLGDRWTPENAAEGKYIWLSITFEEDKPVIYWNDLWEGNKIFAGPAK